MFQDQGIVPDDILIEILSRLEVKSLIRLRCVCKSWCSLIDDVNFIKIHHRFHYSICKANEDISFICDGPIAYDLTKLAHRVSLLSKHTGDVPLDLTPNLLVAIAPYFTNTPPLFNKGFMIGAAEGIVCIYWGRYQDFGLWNPATREFKAVTPWLSRPYRAACPKLIGFGFDSVSNDFKILRGNRCEDDTSCYELNSLRTKSWKRIREPIPSVRTSIIGMGAYLDGICYWVTALDSPSTPLTRPIEPITPLITAFNFRTEVFEVCNPPHGAIVTEIGYEYDWKVAVYKERLAFIVHRTDSRKKECHFDVWVVTKVDGSDSGFPMSWQHLFRYGPFPASNGIWFDIMDGDLIVSINNEESKPYKPPETSVYNPSTGTFKNIGSEMYMFLPYVESLFPLSK